MPTAKGCIAADSPVRRAPRDVNEEAPCRIRYNTQGRYRPISVRPSSFLGFSPRPRTGNLFVFPAGVPFLRARARCCASDARRLFDLAAHAPLKGAIACRCPYCSLVHAWRAVAASVVNARPAAFQFPCSTLAPQADHPFLADNLTSPPHHPPISRASVVVWEMWDLPPFLLPEGVGDGCPE